MNENIADQFKAEVHRVLREKNLMIKQVALSAKPPIYPAALSRLLNQRRINNLETVERVARALGCEVVVFLREKNESDYQI
jgi:hypothetical protein